MIEPKEDVQLIFEAKKGNKQAFNELVFKYQYKIFKIVSHYVTEPSDVLDIAQDTFIKAYRSLNSFRGDSSFYTWIYRIAINTAKNHAVAQGKKLFEINFELVDPDFILAKNYSKDYGTPERLLICDELKHFLFDVIEHLPSDLRNAILLREIEGMSYQEISEIMHCPVGTVRSRIFRAWEVIEKRMGSHLQD